MRLSKEKTREIVENVRREMVKNPHITIFELQDILCEKYNHIFDKNFLGKLKNKIHRERANRVNKTLNYELACLEDTINEIAKILWKIIDNPDTSNRDVISAIRELRSAKSMLLEAMFNAGIFERQLGIVKPEKKLSEEEKAKLEKIIATVFRGGSGEVEKPKEM